MTHPPLPPPKNDKCHNSFLTFPWPDNLNFQLIPLGLTLGDYSRPGAPPEAQIPASCSLAWDLYQAQTKQKLPGLVSEMEPLLNELKVRDITIFSKSQWKKLTQEKLHLKNSRDIIEMARSYKYKIDRSSFENDDFKMKPYFKEMTTENARLWFKLASYMTPLAMNQRQERRFGNREFVCFGCNGQPLPQLNIDPHPLPHSQHPFPPQDPNDAHESESHLVRCWAYSDLRWAEMDLTRDTDIVKYFKHVLERRAQYLEWKWSAKMRF